LTQTGALAATSKRRRDAAARRDATP